MSRLDELIQELCPDGVAYKTLNEICNISAGGDVPKDTFSKKEISRELEFAGELYDEKIRRRAEQVLFEQMRKYRIFFR